MSEILTVAQVTEIVRDAVGEFPFQNTKQFKRIAFSHEALRAENERLKEAIWPGFPKWEPTQEKPQQDFYLAMVESFRTQYELDQARIAELEKDRAAVIAQMGHMEQYKKERDAAIAERDGLRRATEKVSALLSKASSNDWAVDKHLDALTQNAFDRDASTGNWRCICTVCCEYRGIVMQFQPAMAIRDAKSALAVSPLLPLTQVPQSEVVPREDYGRLRMAAESLLEAFRGTEDMDTWLMDELESLRRALATVPAPAPVDEAKS